MLMSGFSKFLSKNAWMGYSSCLFSFFPMVLIGFNIRPSSFSFKGFYGYINYVKFVIRITKGNKLYKKLLNN